MKSRFLCIETLLSAAFILASGSAMPAVAQSIPTYKNPSASTQSRIADLLQRMTLEEKVAQLESASTLPSFVKAPGVFDGAGIDVAQARRILGNGIGTYAFIGDFAGDAGTPQEGARKRNLLQK